jgi:hypothetical protein
VTLLAVDNTSENMKMTMLAIKRRRFENVIESAMIIVWNEFGSKAEKRVT